MYVAKQDIDKANRDTKFNELDNLNNDLKKLNNKLNNFTTDYKSKLYGKDYDLIYNNFLNINQNINKLYEKTKILNVGIKNANMSMFQYLGNDDYINEEYIYEINYMLNSIQQSINSIKYMLSKSNGYNMQYLKSQIIAYEDEMAELVKMRSKIEKLKSVDSEAAGMIKAAD